MIKILFLAIVFILATGCSYLPRSVKNVTSTDRGVVYNTNCATNNCNNKCNGCNKISLNECNNCNKITNNCNDCNKLVNNCNNCNQKQTTNNKPNLPKNTPILEKNRKLRVNVIGQGVAPTNTSSPAQAYALAKRAAIAEGYRLLAEKIKGVYVEGQDLVKNMMVTRSSVRTSVSATIRNANLVETTFKEGLCEVEMEVTISYSQFAF